MLINVSTPAAPDYQGTTVWYLDLADGWTIGDLLADIAHAARTDPEGCVLTLLGEQLEPGMLCEVVLADGDSVALERG